MYIHDKAYCFAEELKPNNKIMEDKNPTVHLINQRIRDAMEIRKVNPNQLAVELGTTASAVTDIVGALDSSDPTGRRSYKKILNGKKVALNAVSATRLLSIAKALNVDILYLYGKQDELLREDTKARIKQLESDLEKCQDEKERLQKVIDKLTSD